MYDFYEFKKQLLSKVQTELALEAAAIAAHSPDANAKLKRMSVFKKAIIDSLSQEQIAKEKKLSVEE